MQLLEAIESFEDREGSFDDERRAMQTLINAGTWGLQGSYGRAMMEFIEAGFCALGHEGCRDYWGNYVPSRDEVEPGTKGSVEYVEAHGFEVLDG